jgi:hypothetical protein
MDGSGSSYNPLSTIFISLVLHILTQLKSRRMKRERIVYVFQIRDILIPIDIDLKGCCATILPF